ncbi:alpha/beta hydrolase family protein [Cohnella herbarum]|uniref:Alpha/beta fold hydrolase n=1 Tax=Cohnella herbarum TaxID=2728023 RepID=A0A7Z2VQM9_9BACL|nr:alpha/beta fold hydrolase [Cohnella herbarum]QJD87150.1 alpha/beta fold hydrolase [Cohnella herbarum]
MPARIVKELACQAGDDTIRCRFHAPVRGDKSSPVPGILVIPGFADTAVGPHNMHVQLADRLARAGYAVVRFDYRGLGESDGDFAKFTLSRGLEDAASVLELLCRQDEVDPGKIGIVGFSLGGTFAAEIAATNSGVRAVSLLAPVAYPSKVFPAFFQSRHWDQLERTGWMDWLGWSVGRPFIESLREMDPLAAMERVASAVLAIHGTNDIEVPIENAYAYAAMGAELYLVDGADHPFSGMRYKEALFTKIGEWLHKHLEIDSAEKGCN